jgi:hypothetical protein
MADRQISTTAPENPTDGQAVASLLAANPQDE